MVFKNKYPICEFDTGKNPIIQAGNFLAKSLPEKCVVTFFKKELEQFKTKRYRWGKIAAFILLRMFGSASDSVLKQIREIVWGRHEEKLE